MNRTAKIAITIAIGVVLIGTATAFAYNAMMDSQTAGSPMSYIPYDSSLVLWVNYNGTSLYLFQSNNTTAVLLNSIGIKSGNISFTAGNSSFNFPVSYNSTYDGFQIYSINVSSALSSMLDLNFSLVPLLNITDRNLFAYMTDGGNVVIGSIGGIENSINSFNSGSNFVSRSSFINQNDNLSFYYSPTNKTLPFAYAWGGANETSFNAFVELTNTTPFNFTGSMTYQGFELKSISPHEIEVSYEFGSLSQLYAKLDSMR
ncbi:MAG: hypothetical protein M0Z77_03000 [Thermoplasmatales archaeon]|nr:hypothetical protein [Candidatus Thermoplasmatota archaeon]MCL6002033.1 hypothetical protein [Candidatus Thermoplasmatota archaeon]MDA8054605.1 hypothetical protein [Thermoplasmatales archaeon]